MELPCAQLGRDAAGEFIQKALHAELDVDVAV
jgi:hypothetical protein